MADQEFEPDSGAWPEGAGGDYSGDYGGDPDVSMPDVTIPDVSAPDIGPLSYDPALGRDVGLDLPGGSAADALGSTALDVPSLADLNGIEVGMSPLDLSKLASVTDIKTLQSWKVGATSDQSNLIDVAIGLKGATSLTPDQTVLLSDLKTLKDKTAFQDAVAQQVKDLTLRYPDLTQRHLAAVDLYQSAQTPQDKALAYKVLDQVDMTVKGVYGDKFTPTPPEYYLKKADGAVPAGMLAKNPELTRDYNTLKSRLNQVLSGATGLNATAIDISAQGMVDEFISKYNNSLRITTDKNFLAPDTNIYGQPTSGWHMENILPLLTLGLTAYTSLYLQPKQNKDMMDWQADEKAKDRAFQKELLKLQFDQQKMLTEMGIAGQKDIAGINKGGTPPAANPTPHF